MKESSNVYLPTGVGGLTRALSAACPVQVRAVAAGGAVLVNVNGVEKLVGSPPHKSSSVYK